MESSPQPLQDIRMQVCECQIVASSVFFGFKRKSQRQLEGSCQAIKVPSEIIVHRKDVISLTNYVRSHLVVVDRNYAITVVTKQSSVADCMAYRRC